MDMRNVSCAGLVPVLPCFKYHSQNHNLTNATMPAKKRTSKKTRTTPSTAALKKVNSAANECQKTVAFIFEGYADQFFKNLTEVLTLKGVKTATPEIIEVAIKMTPMPSPHRTGAQIIKSEA